MRADQVADRTESTLGLGSVELNDEAVTEVARRVPFWEADVVPMMERFRESGEPGALVTVMAGDLVLTGEVLARRPAGAQARARVVLDAVMAGARKTGVLPERLHVRDAALAEALRPELEARGIVPEPAPLTELDEALQAALEHLGGSTPHALASAPWRWAEVEASFAELAEFHAATAAYHRAAPWRQLADSDALLLSIPGDEEPWGASVMGGGSIHYGLALYSDPDDLLEMLEGDGEPSDEIVSSLRGLSLSMSYDPAHELPKPMRREVVTAGWDVAGPDAYPTLMGIKVPGRRITAELLRRVSLACRAVVAFVSTNPDELPWLDPATGVEVDMLLDDGDDSIVLPWPRLAVSHPVGPAGPKADAEAALHMGQEAIASRETTRLRRFSAWVQRQNPSRAAYDRLVRTATMWVDMLVGYGVPAESVTEYDLRLFLYQYLVRFDVPTKPVAKYLTRSLSRLFEFCAVREGIEYPWARFVLDELDQLAEGEDDVRDVLEDVSDMLSIDLVLRGLRPQAEVAGTLAGWSLVFSEKTAKLREELHRNWLIWHDEVVRSGITDPADVRDVLLGRQRQWENTSDPRLGGRTPKQALIDAELGLPADDD